MDNIIKRGGIAVLLLLMLYSLSFWESGRGNITGFAALNSSNANSDLNLTSAPQAQSIAVKLEYKANTVYDEDNNGIEPIGSAVDFTVEGTDFNWAVDESKLCTKWAVYSVEDDALTTVCHGSNDCCGFIDLVPRRELWKDPLYLTLGEFGSGFNNVVNAQVIYADYNISEETLRADIVYSEWSNLTAKFYLDKIPFKNVCVDTCSLKGAGKSAIKLIMEIENAELSIDTISYTVSQIQKIKSEVLAKDSEGSIDVEYKMLKDGNIVADSLVRPDIYDIEVSPENNIIEKISLESVNYTAPITIGIDSIEKDIMIEGLEIRKKFAVDPPDVDFESATLTSTAAADSLYKCRLWDFEKEICFGEWDMVRNLTEGQSYNISLTKDDPGFIEGKRRLRVTPNLKLQKKDFRVHESPALDFEFITEEELKKNNKWKQEYEMQLEGGKGSERRKTRWSAQNESIEAFVYDRNGTQAALDVEISKLREGKFKIDVPKKRSFRPGLYSLKVKLVKDNSTYVQEQNFTWGVLSINVNKSIYQPNQFVFIGIGVLDDLGKTVCDADVTLEIINPLNKKTTLTTLNNDIVISDECKVYGLTSMPDYYSYYTVGGEGNYILNLTAITNNGVRNVQDNFSVQTNVDFDVERKGPVRIYPFKVQTMNITIKANQNYKGAVREYTPSSFFIIPQQGLITSDSGDTKTLSWDVDLKKDDIIKLSYQFDAPDKSPEFYLLGALDIGSFAEARQWQIANDAATLADDGLSVNGTKTITGSNGSIFLVQANLSGSAAEPSGIRIGIMDDGMAIGNNSCNGSADFMCNSTQVSCTGTVCTNFYNCTIELGDFHPSDSIRLNFTIRACSSSEPAPSFNILSSWQNGSSEEFDLDVNITINDTVKPAIVTSINNSAPKYGDAVNITANVTDESSLSQCQFVINQSSSGAKDYFNKSVAGTSDQCSQNFTISFIKGGVINFSVIVNDTSNNINQSDQIITIVNKEPSIALNAPVNNSVSSSSYNLLNATITDTDNDSVDIYLWGSNDSSLFNTSLLYIAKAQGSSNGGVNITYNWTSPVLQPDNSTLLLMHFDNRSEFGETTDGINNLTYDFSGKGNDGSIYGAVWNSSGGKFGGAFEFNGTDRFINSTLVQRGVTNYTIEAWVKTRTNQGVIINNRGGGSGLSITLAIGPLCSTTKGTYCAGSAAGIPAIGVDSDGVWIGTNGLTAVNDGGWHHLAGVFNTTSGNGVTPASFSIYVDGQLESGNAGAIGAAVSPLTGVNETRIGWHRPWLIYFNGTIDELAIHNRTLSAAEILNHYRLKEGNYYWKVNSTDGALSAESVTRQFRIDPTVPIINGSVNSTSTKIYDVINASFNATDDSGISTGQIVINDTGAKRYFNFTLSGTSAQFSQNFTISCGRGCIINITGIVSDGSNSRQNTTLITVGNTPPSAPSIVFPINNLKTRLQPLPLNVTFAADNNNDPINISYYINGVLNQTSLANATLNASDGEYMLNVSLYDGTDFSANATANFTIDITKPAVNMSINNSSPRTGSVVNISANASDSSGLSFCQFIINQTGAKEFFNKSVNGNNDRCSQNFTVALGGSVINFTAIVNDSVNNINQSELIISTVANSVPVIKVINSSGFSVDPFEAGVSAVLVSFNVTDADNVSQINASKAIANFTLEGRSSGIFRFNDSCANHTEGISVIINCTVEMRYYDNASSLWKINISVEDINGGIGRNDSFNFTYNSLTAAAIINSLLNFSNVTLGQNNAPSKAPVIINNTGNTNFNLINITASQLVGVANASLTIQPSSFSVNLTNSSNGAGLQLSNLSIRLPDSTGNAALQFGIGGFSNISIFVFLDVPSSGLISQEYNSTWNLTLSAG